MTSTQAREDFPEGTAIRIPTNSSTSMAASEVKITTAGREYKSKTADLLAIIFKDDPVIRFMLSSLTPAQRQAYMNTYFHTLLKAAMLNDAVFQEADDFASMAVWLKPGKKVVNYYNILQSGFIPTLWKLGFGGVKRMLVDFVSVSDGIKERRLREKGIERFYYLFFVGTVAEQQGRGLARVLIGRWQERCVEEGGGGAGVPIWLEATTPKSRDVYVKCGFEVVEEMVMGVGTHNCEGEFEKGGEGVRLWAMLWMPGSKERKPESA